MSSILNTLQHIERIGEIEQYVGLKLVSNGPPQVFVGEICEILDTKNNFLIHAEVIGFNQGKVYLMPFATAKISMGYKVRATGQLASIAVGQALQGRILNALAQPIDHEKPLQNTIYKSIQHQPINPLKRKPISMRLNTGIHAMDVLLPLGKGQRIGLFAGSGVGKSMLLGMLAKHMNSDINVIALIGERGREVNDFIHNHLSEETKAKSIIIVACSDDFPLMRKQAAYTATTIAEYFCQQGKNVMLFMDSITRFAMAQREIGISLGEPPTARGYTPSVFSSLPNLIERAGNFAQAGSITSLYTVLVEGDDFNEPIADTMRSLLDGHIVLTRELAHRGHYPAIDVLQSISRLAKQLTTPDEQQIMQQLIALIGLYKKNQDLIELGAYQPGTHLALDNAVQKIEAIQQLFIQNTDTSFDTAFLFEKAKEILR